MKTIKLIFALAVLFISQKVEAQTIAVAPINTYKVAAHPSTVSKMVRMEIIRLNKYSVLDQFDMYEVENIEDYAVYYYNQNKLVIRKSLTKRVLGRTLFHELFHIIISVNDFKVAPHGEERVAEWSEEYYNILKQNKVLRNLLIRCILVE